MQKKMLLSALSILAIFAIILSAGCTGNSNTSNEPTVEVVEISAAQQVNSLDLKQIDGMINWQPNIASGMVTGIGKLICYSPDLPRSDNNTWKEHTCCVFGANEAGLANKELATTLTGLMLLGNQYINTHLNESVDAVSNWMFGKENLTFGSHSASPTDIIKTSLPSIKFSTNISQKWKDSNYEFVEIERNLDILKNNLKSTSREDTEALIYNHEPYDAAKKIIDENGKFPEPTANKIKIGHLLSDHDAPLYVLLKDWKYFKDHYNAYLKPVQEKNGEIENAELYVNDKKICDVQLVQGSGGPNLMTLLQTNEIQYAIAGTPPYLSSIDVKTGLKILSPIMTEGSGFLVRNDAPANNWNDFVNWVKERSASGKNIIVAVPQFNSIQDIQLKEALKASGIKYQIKSA